MLLPFLLLLLSVSNILFISLISILPPWEMTTPDILWLRLGCLALTSLVLGRYRDYFVVRPRGAEWLILLPYFLIMLIRFPLIYPTYDDLAAHLMWGDYASRMWAHHNFMPMGFANYFYLPLDMNYTPFLYLIGIRLTVWLFYSVTSLWFFSIYVRFSRQLVTSTQKILLAILFLVIPLIPHLLGVIGTLMGDYIALAFCLEALYLLMRKDNNKTFAVIVAFVALLVKQSNSVFIAPILLYYIYLHRKQIHWISVILWGIIAAPFFVRLSMETGNPLSGLFNGVFQSTLYPLSNFKQTLFGPENVFQVFLWPMIGQFGGRYAEGIVSTPAKLFFAPIPVVGYCLSIWLMIKRRSIKYGLLVLSYLLWSYLVGYARYYVALNLMALLVLIFEIKDYRALDSWIHKSKYAVLGLVFLGSLSSLKTDFSWRPHPSLATPGANAYYLREYREGLSYVGQDTLPNIAKRYHDFFAPYEAVITVYRGPVTFVSYMGYLNGLPVYEGVSTTQYNAIMTDQKIGEAIKGNLADSFGHNKILLLADKPFDRSIESLKLYQDFRCTPMGSATKDPYLQREAYFTQTVIFSCEKP